MREPQSPAGVAPMPSEQGVRNEVAPSIPRAGEAHRHMVERQHQSGSAVMTDKLRAAMQQALEALEELFHSNSTKIAVEKYNTAHNDLREALEHSGEANEMVVGWDRVKPEAIASDPLYQQGFVDGVEEGRNQVAEQAEQEPVLTDEKGQPVRFWGGKSTQPVSQEPTINFDKLHEMNMQYVECPCCGSDMAMAYSPKQPVTTPDVCGEVCERAKLCYGCGMALDEANRIHEERFDYELDNAPFRGMGEVSPSTKLYMKELQETLSGQAERVNEAQEPDANNFTTTGELMVALGKSPEEAKRIQNDLENSLKAEQKLVGYVSQSVVDWLSSNERSDTAYSSINLYKKPRGSSDAPLYAVPVSIHSESETDSSSSSMRTTVRTKDLTDEEIVYVLEYYDDEWDETTFAIARAVVEKFKEKNK